MVTAKDSAPLFHPTFGSRPEQIVGRDAEISQFVEGLDSPIGSRDRCTLFLGQRGLGKTALLLELADHAASNDFVVARVTAYEGMADTIIELVQLNGAKYIRDDRRRAQGMSAGALGFSFGLTFSSEAQAQYGFRAKLGMLCDKLAEQGKGVLILIDEVHTSSAMREVAITYQELVGDGKNIAMGMAGLPHAVSGVLNDHVLTFLNRARRVNLGPISVAAIRAYYAHAFSKLEISCPDELLDQAADKTQGLPYLMQLIGYYLVQYTQDTRRVDDESLEQSVRASRLDLEENVFKPILAPLSRNDRIFLDAMAQQGESVSTADLGVALGEKGPAIQPYRKRLIEAGIIEAPRRGELVFAVPFLAEYLRKCAASE